MVGDKKLGGLAGSAMAAEVSGPRFDSRHRLLWEKRVFERFFGVSPVPTLSIRTS